MQVDLTVEQEAFIQQAIASGRYRTAEEAVQEAMARWEEGERARLELMTALDEAESDLAGGRYSDYTDETLPNLAVELKSEARGLHRSERS
jgi:putative addiction module CopG family antidote